MERIIYLAIILVLTVPCLAQNKRLTEKDKLLIVNYVLANTNFQSGANGYDKVIYLSSENLPDSFLTLRNKTFDGMKVELLNSKEIEKRTVYGFDYWQFEPFEVKRNDVNVSFARKFSNTTAGAGNSFGKMYNCKRIGKSWKCGVAGLRSVMT